ncbi:LCP family protein [Paenibacillus sp. alder61]|uniref:LytR family transcriptional regulator n=1 Tax=Paenibacillus faecis TaxID=862114 RepID=A0A5D0CQE3_9BACL|nr:MULTISPECIES: LCP family protein [Paenibacillus]MCA1293355.1 LCP family protein [Paenibacillus sp. alder61]TYA12022.1 LytR family transcriptional regulator [Paenibacillus faecis]
MSIRTKAMVWGAALLLLMLGAGLYAYGKLEPSRHFRQTEIPVLATPDTAGADAAGNGSAAGPLTAKAGAGVAAKVDSGGSTGGSGSAGSIGSTGSIAPGSIGPAGSVGSAGNAGSAGNLGSAGFHGPGTSAKGSSQRPQPAGFNILILGTDARDREASRTDVIMLAHVDPEQPLVNLVSIPRDTRVPLSGIGYTKINHAHALGELHGDTRSGTKSAVQAVSNLCSCTINYYIKTDFEGFEHFIDTLGGLDVHLDAPVKLTYAYMTLPAGKNHLSGAEALDLVRERKSLPGGDSGRQANQAMVLKEIIRSVIQPKNLKNLPSLIEQVREDVLDTNLRDADLISLAWLAKDLKEDQFRYAQLPGQSGKAWDPLVKNELYYWVPDAPAWEKLAKELLQ